MRMLLKSACIDGDKAEGVKRTAVLDLGKILKQSQKRGGGSLVPGRALFGKPEPRSSLKFFFFLYRDVIKSGFSWEGAHVGVQAPRGSCRLRAPNPRGATTALLRRGPFKRRLTRRVPAPTSQPTSVRCPSQLPIGQVALRSRLSALPANGRRSRGETELGWCARPMAGGERGAGRRGGGVGRRDRGRGSGTESGGP